MKIIHDLSNNALWLYVQWLINFSTMALILWHIGLFDVFLLWKEKRCCPSDCAVVFSSNQLLETTYFFQRNMPKKCEMSRNKRRLIKTAEVDDFSGSYLFPPRPLWCWWVKSVIQQKLVKINGFSNCVSYVKLFQFVLVKIARWLRWKCLIDCT